MSGKTGAKVRAVSAEVVDAVVQGGRSLDAAISEHEQRVVVNDRALLRMIAYGSLRHYWQLQSYVDRLLSKPLRKRDSVINALLLGALYQIAEMRIPDHAVVSESVEAVRRLRRPKLAGLVNACLRRFLREGDAIRAPNDAAAEWNHPAWLIDKIQSDWPEDWRSVLTANMARAPMWLRANASIMSAEHYQQTLQAEGISAECVAGLPEALRLAEPQPVEQLPGFFEGHVSVQDAAAQIAARWLLQGQSGRVLDACAAPGGKSGHILELGGDQVSLISIDSDPARVESIAENLARIGADATIIAADASKPEQWWDKKPFDAILLDAPCSATGVIRRHPDIKLLRRESDIASLAALQGELLRALWSLLAPGGRLLYATCSVLAEENDGVVGPFIAQQDDATETDLLPNNNIRDLMLRKACGYQILPGTADMDGFYYAALQKKKVS